MLTYFYSYSRVKLFDVDMRVLGFAVSRISVQLRSNGCEVIVGTEAVFLSEVEPATDAPHDPCKRTHRDECLVQHLTHAHHTCAVSGPVQRKSQRSAVQV
jgi:hypothetical protein